MLALSDQRIDMNESKPEPSKSDWHTPKGRSICEDLLGQLDSASTPDPFDPKVVFNMGEPSPPSPDRDVIAR